MSGLQRISGVVTRHAFGFVEIVAVVVGIPSVHSLISGMDLNTDQSKVMLLLFGIIASGVSFALGLKEMGLASRREISEIENCNADALKEKEAAIAGKEAAIQREKEKNAELAARWEKLNSEERRKRETFDVLSEREKWCLSHVVDDWPKKHSASGSVILASYDVLTRAGILIDQGESKLYGQMAHTYTISLEWRKWVFNHSDELPEPNLKMPE